VWSQRNVDLYGRDHAEEITEQPVNGIVEALIRARIPYTFIHLDDLERQSADVGVLVLPELAVMSDAHCQAVRAFVAGGGGLLATGRSSALDAGGAPRADFALAGLFGAHLTEPLRDIRTRSGYVHSYLRIENPRHQALAGFDGTAILPYGGGADPIRAEPQRNVPLTFIPPFPVFPPESSFMAPERTSQPMLVLSDGKGRVAYLAADIDRRYAQDHLPDHARLLANLVDWTSRGRRPILVEGSGLFGIYPYRQDNRVVVHILNWNFAEAWRAPVEEVLPQGPLRIAVNSLSIKSARLLVDRSSPAIEQIGEWSWVRIPRVAEHEVVLFE
jgi:hypothetical protein